jgi:hypothetical protein
MKTKHYSFLMLIVIGVFLLSARQAFTADDLLGTWKYMISDVPAEYQTGSLVFEQKDNKTVGYVESTGKNEIRELTVDQGKVTFITENDNGVFKYSLVQKGDTLSGTIASQYGDFKMKAVRQPK